MPYQVKKYRKDERNRGKRVARRGFEHFLVDINILINHEDEKDMKTGEANYE